MSDFWEKSFLLCVLVLFPFSQFALARLLLMVNASVYHLPDATFAPTEKKAIEEVLALAGAWGERDWNEVEAELDHIRHSSKPTPPFTL